MSNRVTTGAGPWLVSEEIEVDTINAGSATVQVWEGSETECRGYLSLLIAYGATKLKLSPKGDGNWQVRGSYPFDKQGQNKSFVDTMELEVNAVMKSIYLSPVYRARFSDYNSISQDSYKARQTLPIIDDCKSKYKSGQPKRGSDGLFSYQYFDSNTANDGDTNPATDPVVKVATREEAIQRELGDRLNQAGFATGSSEFISATQLFENVAFRGVTSFIEYNHVFRRRVTAGSPNAYRANSVGGGKVWTSAEVIAWEGIPQNGWFDLPVDVQWHKDKPRVIAAYGQRTEISYTYTEIVTATAIAYNRYGSAVMIDT